MPVPTKTRSDLIVNNACSIFLDDERNADFIGWQDRPNIIVVRNFEEFTAAVKKHRNIYAISFDHDLGGFNKSGYDCITWLEEQIYYGNIICPIDLECHSQNPSGKQRIDLTIQAIYDREHKKGETKKR